MERREYEEIERVNKVYVVNKFTHKRRETGRRLKLTVNPSGATRDVIS